MPSLPNKALIAGVVAGAFASVFVVCAGPKALDLRLALLGVKIVGVVCLGTILSRKIRAKSTLH